ncbi:MAG: glycoside hydrolase family 38 C-terminal domain-containing protein, partial [Candidatus Hodarchaeota archaeon]
QIGNEVFNLSFMYLSNLINFKHEERYRIALILFNPLPWKRKDIVIFNGISKVNHSQQKFPKDFKLIDLDNNEIEYQGCHIPGEPRFLREIDINYQFSFLADVPACGYKVYYVILEETAKKSNINEDAFILNENSIENEFYKVKVKNSGQINIFDKKRNMWFENICQFEDVADWGDEYDYSGPARKQADKKYMTQDAEIIEIIPFLDGPSHKSVKIKMILKLPVSLSPDRLQRENNFIENTINLYISLYKGINRIDFKIDLENKSKDHRIRVLFPSNIISDTIQSDGHFFIVPRNVILPKDKHWAQKSSKTNHQKDFIAIKDETRCFAVLNRGLPEYEAIKNEDGTITVAITLLRSIGWLSRPNLDSRRSDAGPSLKTPGAQCIGNYTFELSLVIEDYQEHWLDSKVHIKGKEFNCPLKPLFPLMLTSTLKNSELLMLSPMGVLSAINNLKDKKVDSYLPNELSFLEIDNKNIILSTLKKSENGNNLIVRVYNISPFLQKANLSFFKEISIRNAEIVNFLEHEPKNEIKAKINKIYQNILTITMEPHVIATIKLEFYL